MITLIFYSNSHAVVKIVSKKNTNTENRTSNATTEIKRPKKVITKNKKPKQLYINGYIDSKYVRLVVEFENENHLTGYLFEQNKTKKYIYGEKINNVLYIYDPSGQRLTVILAKNSKP